MFSRRNCCTNRGIATSTSHKSPFLVLWLVICPVVLVFARNFQTVWERFRILSICGQVPNSVLRHRIEAQTLPSAEYLLEEARQMSTWLTFWDLILSRNLSVGEIYGSWRKTRICHIACRLKHWPRWQSYMCKRHVSCRIIELGTDHSESKVCHGHPKFIQANVSVIPWKKKGMAAFTPFLVSLPEPKKKCLVLACKCKNLFPLHCCQV